MKAGARQVGSAVARTKVESWAGSAATRSNSSTAANENVGAQHAAPLPLRTAGPRHLTRRPPRVAPLEPVRDPGLEPARQYRSRKEVAAARASNCSRVALLQPLG